MLTFKEGITKSFKFVDLALSRIFFFLNLSLMKCNFTMVKRLKSLLYKKSKGNLYLKKKNLIIISKIRYKILIRKPIERWDSIYRNVHYGWIFLECIYSIWYCKWAVNNWLKSLLPSVTGGTFKNCYLKGKCLLSSLNCTIIILTPSSILSQFEKCSHNPHLLFFKTKPK